MPRQCITCAHEDREEIEKALRSGDIPRVVSEKWPELNENAVRRHAAHMDKDGMAIVVRPGSQTALAQAVSNASLLSELSALYATAQTISTHAMNRGNEQTALKAVTTQISILASVHKLDESEKNAQDAAVNAAASEDLRTLVTALKYVLPQYAGVGEALAAKLEDMGEWQTAQNIRQLTR